MSPRKKSELDELQLARLNSNRFHSIRCLFRTLAISCVGCHSGPNHSSATEKAISFSDPIWRLLKQVFFLANYSNKRVSCWRASSWPSGHRRYGNDSRREPAQRNRAKVAQRALKCFPRNALPRSGRRSEQKKTCGGIL